jgi:hypothetical protein
MTDSTPPKPVDPRQLWRALIEHFDENELRDLCFELSIDYENLPPGGKKDKARELILYYSRRKRLNLLVTVFYEKRPGLPIESIELSDEDEDPTLTDIQIPPAPTAKPQDASNTVIAGQSFTALIRFLNKADVKTAVVSFQTDFEAASEQIATLAEYKLVHDLLQELENRYFLIQNDQKRLPADETAWDTIAINEPELQGKMNDLINVIQRNTFPTDEKRLAQSLEKAKEQIRTGVEDFKLEELKTGIRAISRVLNREPTRINAALVATASALRLDNLQQAMETISINLDESGIELDVLVELQKGGTALNGLDTRLNGLVDEHDNWQRVDDELRRVESSLIHGIEDLEDAWYELEPMTRTLLNGTEESWVAELDSVLLSLTEALKEQFDAKVKRLFRRYRSQVGRRFRQVDLELLTLCQDLQRIGESLDMLLRQFQK